MDPYEPIDKGQSQPVQFITGDEVRLPDVKGNELIVRIDNIMGRTSR